jgi:hypothetical protein
VIGWCGSRRSPRNVAKICAICWPRSTRSSILANTLAHRYPGLTLAPPVRQ